MAIKPLIPYASYGRYMDLDSIKDNCRVDEDGCWIWRGHSIDGKHPSARINGISTLIRRQIFSIQGKYLKCGRQHVVRPSCGTLTCVCPDHLEVVTRNTLTRESMGQVNIEVRTAKTMKARIEAGQVKLSYDKAQEIRLDTRRSDIVAAEYGVHVSMVRRIIRGEAWVAPLSGSSVFTFRPA